MYLFIFLFYSEWHHKKLYYDTALYYASGCQYKMVIMVLHSAENSMNKACCGLGAFLVLNLPNFRHTSNRS